MSLNQRRGTSAKTVVNGIRTYYCYS